MNGLKLGANNGKGLVGSLLANVQNRFFPDNMQQFDDLAINGDPRIFYTAAAEKGYYDETDIRGTPLVEYRELFLRGRRTVMEDHAQKYSNLAGIALKRFPELERGESIGVLEIRERLRQLKAEGYDVGRYSNMDKRRLWDHWTHVKQEIRRRTDVYCPKVLAEIDEMNRRQAEDAGSHL